MQKSVITHTINTLEIKNKNEKYIYFYLKKYYYILDKQFYDR